MGKGKLAGSNKADELDYNDSDSSSEKVSFFTCSDAMEQVERELSYKGYMIVPAIGGEFCMYSVYTKHYPKVPGITFPDSFWYWRKIDSCESADRTKFHAILKETCEDLLDSSGWKGYQRINEDFADRPADPRSSVSGTAFNRVRYSDSSMLATLTGKTGYHKYVPKREWFSSDVQAIDARSLLTLFPDAEAQMMMLALGRLVSGSSGTKIAEGNLEHTWRSYCILVGTSAGMGKSTLLSKYLGDALGKMGYICTRAPMDDTKFGWGRPAVSDLCFYEDLTPQSQKALITGNRTKTIVSNEVIPCEEKGQPRIEVKAKALLLACTNKYTYSDFIGMDNGQLSRLNLLYTYTEDDLARQYPDLKQDARIKPYWEKLARQLQVTTDTLMMYLLRTSLDMFLDVVGMEPEHEWLTRNPDKDNLEMTVKGLREQFVVDTKLSHAEELVKQAGHLLAITISQQKAKGKATMLAKLAELDYSSDLLLVQMELFTRSTNERYSGVFEKLELVHLSQGIKGHVRGKLADFRKYHLTKTSDECFSLISKELVAKSSGFLYPGKLSHYSAGWLETKRNIPDLVNHYAEVLQDEELEPALLSATNRISELFSNITL